MNITDICKWMHVWWKSQFISSENKKEYERKQYTDELILVFKADFLALGQKEKQDVLDSFGCNSIEKLLENISIPDLWTLELLLLKKLSNTELLRRAWVIREKFRFQMGDDVYKKYTDNLPEVIKDDGLRNPSNLKDDEYNLLRDDIVNITRQMQRLGYYRIKRNESISERKRYIIKFTVMLTLYGVLFTILILLNGFFGLFSEEQSIISAKFFLLIIYSGIAGTAISLLQRIEKASNIPPHITDSIHEASDVILNMSDAYITSLVVSGAFFALIVHFISIAEIVNVLDFLPKLSTNPNTPAKQAFIQLISPPAIPKDFAKLLIACFLSGFAERLIPDTLDSLIKKTEPVRSS